MTIIAEENQIPTRLILMYSCNGRLAQLGEHLAYIQKVAGSSPAPPTQLSSIILV